MNAQCSEKIVNQQQDEEVGKHCVAVNLNVQKQLAKKESPFAVGYSHLQRGRQLRSVPGYVHRDAGGAV